MNIFTASVSNCVHFWLRIPRVTEESTIHNIRMCGGIKLQYGHRPA